MPNLPTDNLYKFITLGGVFVFAFFMWTALNSTSNLDYSKMAGPRQAIIEGRLKAFGIAAPQNRVGQRGPAELYNSNLDLILKLPKTAETAELLKLNEELLMDRSVRLATLDDIRRDYWTRIGIGAGGFLLAVIGFLQWANRHQIYQDLMVRDQAFVAAVAAAKARKELSIHEGKKVADASEEEISSKISDL